MEKITKIEDAKTYLSRCDMFCNYHYGLWYIGRRYLEIGICARIDTICDRFLPNLMEEYKREYPYNCDRNGMNAKYVKKFANIVKKFSEKPELITLI